MPGDGESPRNQYSLDDLTRRIAALSQAKRSLFELELKKKSVGTHGEAPIRRRAHEEGSPLSFAQQRLWFLSQLEPDSSAYNESRAIRLCGSLDVEALQKSLNQIVSRHDILRTNFLAVDGNPVPVVGNGRAVELQVIDLRAWLGTDRDSKAKSLMVEAIRHPFDLSREPLLRVLLLPLTDQEHLFLFVKHHIVCDAWSTTILLQELAAHYRAFTSGRASSLPELPIQYADYALWQRERLRGEIFERQLLYWRKQLENMSILRLPTDRPRPVVQSHRGAAQSIVLSKETADQLKALSRREGVTLFITLLAAFQSLLQRYTGQGDIVVGAPIAGRTRSETERLIGFFVNTLVLRTDLSGNPTFREALARVRKVALGAYAHQDIPFEKLVEELQPERNLSQSPLFQVMFVLHNAPSAALEFEGLSVYPVGLESITAKFDLSLSMLEEVEGLKGSLEYSTDLFDPVTIERMLIHFQVLLQGIVADPERRLSELPLLTEIERHQLTVEWNETKRDYPKEKCIHQLFEEQVENTPEAVAVVWKHQQLTYRQLNTRANQLARYLRKRGVGPETLVAICMERSIQMIVGLLGILKAGGAYVPLDPEYPKDRLAFMLEDTQAPALLTQQCLIESLPEHSARVVCLDRDWEHIGRESQQNVKNELMANNLAYVIYTSGSTGKPKGVMIEHGCAGALLFWAHTAYPPQDLASVLASTSICFDLSIFELFAPLTCGGKVVLAENAITLPELSTLKVRLINTVPSAINELTQRNGVPPSVRTINLAGERLNTKLVQQIYEKTCAKQVFDLYGPSEATTYSTWTIRTADGPETIGRPISNTRIYILDDDLIPVPIGVPGELHIGGDGLARGYLNQPELTAEKFIPHPFSDTRGDRLYKTGDRARYLPDGNIEFLGRLDDQVKIRGFRIEIGEIEAVLSQYPSTQQAIVVAREDSPGEKTLVAYIIPKPERLLSATELKTFLRSKLPEYMIPSAFVFLHELPLTRNGKVDRRALPVPDRIDLGSVNRVVAPRDAVERQLVQIYANLLGVQTVGVKDNFFDLGGHSLLAVRVMSQIEKTFRKTLPIAALFQAPTVELLASLLREEKTVSCWSPLIPLQTKRSRLPFFWVHGEASNAFLPQYLGPDQPIYGLRHQSEDGYPALYKSVENIAAHYLDEISTVQANGPYHLGGYCFGGMVAFEMAQQLKKQNQEVALLVLLEPSNPANCEFSIPANRNIPSSASNSATIGNQISHRWRNLATLRRKDKFTYLLQRSSGKISETAIEILRSVKRMAQPIIWNLYPSFGYRIPPSLRSPYILKVYNNAIKNYVPGVYAGRLTVLARKGNFRVAQGWEMLALGGVDVHEIPGNHRDILNEPHIRVWAEKLKACLQTAQNACAK